MKSPPTLSSVLYALEAPPDSALPKQSPLVGSHSWSSAPLQAVSIGEAQRGLRLPLNRMRLTDGSLVPFRIAVGCSIVRAMPIEETTKLLEAPRPPSACLIDFFEARDRLKLGLHQRGQNLGTRGKFQKPALHRLPSIKRVDHLEESIYWLLSAVMLVYLLLEIIGR
jgi:hypothetical protein